MTAENEIDRTERLITEALYADGGWLDQKQIRQATGLPMSRVENFTLSMALEDKIDRRLVNGDRTQEFRALTGQAAGPPVDDHEYDEGAEAARRGDWTPQEFAAQSASWRAGYAAARLPAAEAHAPLSLLNLTGQGVRTMITCSCGWGPGSQAGVGSRTLNNAHLAHRRRRGLSGNPDTVFGEGPWAGQTWDAWYAAHRDEGLDPYTGLPRAF